MGLPHIFGLCAAFLFASSVGAVTIDLGPSDYRNFGPNATNVGSGVRSSFGQTVRIPPAGGALTVTRNPVIPYGSIANGMKNFVRINPYSAAASAAITAAFLGLDWVFDEELDSWMKEDWMEAEYSGVTWNVPECPGNLRAPSAAAACEYPVNNQCGVVASLREMKGTPDGLGAVCVYNLKFGNPPQGTEIRPRGTCIEGEWRVVNNIPGCYLPGVVPLEPQDWAEMEAYLPTVPATAADSASDLQQRQGQLPGYHDTTITGPSSVAGPSSTSTSTDPATGDTTTTTTNTTTNISYGDTTITTTNTTVTNTYQNGQQTGTSTTTETPGELPVAGGGGGAGDWPGFCDWATVVCDWLNWTREDPPPEQDLPSVIDDDFYEEKNISFGSKTCPPDYQISLEPFMSVSVGVSFQPLCDFAALIYYMVMAASYIIAAYISIGVARSA